MATGGKPKRVKQERVDAMMARTVCELTGEATVAGAWSRLFRHLNRARGKGDVGYSAGEQIAIKPNWVGMIFGEGHVNLDTYAFISRQDYMNTAPQMILALINQLASVGVAPQNITVCDTLACLVHEYYDLLHGAYSAVRYEDHAGKFERVKVKPSQQPLHWSSRPQGKAQDYLPACFADAQYLINFANLKAHTGGGVTLCAKNHFGSLIRTPGPAGVLRHPSQLLFQRHGDLPSAGGPGRASAPGRQDGALPGGWVVFRRASTRPGPAADAVASVQRPMVVQPAGVARPAGH